MVDSIVDSLVSLAIENLAKVVENEVVLLVGVTNEIKKLSSTFTSIQAVLKDAETRRLRDDEVKNWLERLKDVAYDVDDILDEWMTEKLTSQAPDEDSGSCFSKKKVRSFLSSVNCFNHVVLRHKIGSGIKEVRGRLDDIEKEKNQFNFITREVDSEVREGEIRNRETSSLLDPFNIVGREDVKNKVVDLLVGGSSREVNEVPFVISIVGMGGLGKTTLAQLIYNDEKVKGHFQKRMWVCVSDDFDVKRVTKSIIESAVGSGCEDLGLDLLQSRLSQKLQAKRFLLVLDDVWSEDREKWDKLRLPFQAGALGSRIVITTRSEKVAQAMQSAHIHKLAALSKDECWLLFSRGAFEHRNAEERSELEEIGKEIVKKCGGLPLAAKTIGCAMWWRRTRREWALVLESEIWNSGDILGGILPALLLSYYDLPAALKQCFAYCSIFPKDWEIQKDTIVKLWVAQGFICSKGSQDMEEIGGQYFEDLLRRSLLQDAVVLDDDGNIYKCKMHDLVHDLAQFVAGCDCSVVEMRKQSSLNLNNLRHLFLIDSDDAGDRDWATLYKARKLRTLLHDSTNSGVPNNLFHHFRHLRALDLSWTSIQILPRTLGKLKHLRYLDLSETEIEELPEEVSNCRNLQTLRLDYCRWLKKLPRGMGKMISLRHLEFEHTYIKYLPQGIGKLSSLRTLTKFIVGGDDEGCKWGELKHLNHLQGSLQIIVLENVRSRDEAREAELNKKQYLHTLTFDYDPMGYESSADDDQKGTEEMLEILQPHTNLKELKIESYGGSKLPCGWLGQLKALQTLEIISCYKLRSLPEELQHLTMLQQLEIGWCPELTSLPVQLQHLTMLQKLHIYRCPVLEERCREGGEDRYKIAHIPNITFKFVHY